MRFRIEPTGEELSFEPLVVIAAGYTGRDREAVLAVEYETRVSSYLDVTGLLRSP